MTAPQSVLDASELAPIQAHINLCVERCDRNQRAAYALASISAFAGTLVLYAGFGNQPWIVPLLLLGWSAHLLAALHCRNTWARRKRYWLRLLRWCVLLEVMASIADPLSLSPLPGSILSRTPRSPPILS